MGKKLICTFFFLTALTLCCFFQKESGGRCPLEGTPACPLIQAESQSQIQSSSQIQKSCTCGEKNQESIKQ